MQKFVFVLFLMTCLVKTNKIIAQEDSINTIKHIEKKPLLCEIKMHDGSLYKGYIEKQSDTLIYLKSSAGVMVQVPKKQILSIDFINGHTTQDSTGNLTIHIPNISNHYYVTNTNAFLMKKGEVYGSSSYFVFYNINYAFNQHFSLGISTSPLAAPIMLHAKLNFEIAHNLYLGVEGLGGSGSWINAKTYGGGGVAKLTYGDVKKNVTVSGGYGNLNYYVTPRQLRRGGGGRGGRNPGHYIDYNSVLIGAAFTCPISHKLFFVAEVFAAPQIGIYTLSPAFRTVIKPNISWVFGIEGFFNSTPGISTPLIALPYFGFSFRL